MKNILVKNIKKKSGCDPLLEAAINYNLLIIRIFFAYKAYRMHIHKICANLFIQNKTIFHNAELNCIFYIIFKNEIIFLFEFVEHYTKF